MRKYFTSIERKYRILEPANQPTVLNCHIPHLYPNFTPRLAA